MLPRRKNIRLPYYDYHTNGMYFITICTKKKQHVFGKISDGKIVLNPLGQYARKRLQTINNSYPDVQVIHAIVMPVVSRLFRKFISSASKYRNQIYGFSSSFGCSISILNRCSMSIIRIFPR